MRVSPPEPLQASRRLLSAGLIIAAVSAGFIFRDWFSTHVLPPPPRMQGETTQAYRYSAMISEGTGIPTLDTMVMHPDGMPTSQNSIFEEYVAGGLHGIIGGDLDSFMRTFCLLFPLLVIPGIYLWMRSAGIPWLPAVTSSALYAVLLPALLRTRGESLFRETVALPMLVFLGWLVESSLSSVTGGRRRRILNALFAGTFLFLSLAAWKVTGYVSLLLFLYLLWRDRVPERVVPTELKLSLASAQLAASLFLTHMRHDSALWSPATVLAVILAASVVIGRRTWLPWAATGAALLSALAGPGTTGHVVSVAAAKIRFLFSHPSDPSLLSDDARLFWVSGYTSPGPAQILLLFGIPLLAALPGFRAFRREQGKMLLFWLLPIALAGYLFFDRLHVLLAVALIPVIAMTLVRIRWAVIPVTLLLAVQSIFPGTIAEGLERAGLRMRNDASLLAEPELDSMLLWLQRETGPDEAVLSFWHLSGLISAYADRPVVTHTFFENEENRGTIVEFARSIFQPEDSLIAFMNEKECGLVVYQADFLLDRDHTGLLYLAGLTEVPVNSAARAMHYDPGSLDSLHLLFQGPSLRLFGRGEAPPEQLDRHFLFEERYSGFPGGDPYDNSRIILSDPLSAAGTLADAGIELEDPDMLSGALLLALCGQGPPEVAGQMLNDLIQMYILGIYDLDGLAEDITSMQFHLGPVPDLSLLLARFYAAEGRYEEAGVEYRRVVSLDPDNLEAAGELELLERGGK